MKNKIKIAVTIANPVGWYKKNVLGGGEVIIKDILEGMNNIKIFVVKTKNIKLNKKIVSRTIILPFESKRNLIKDIINLKYWVLKSTLVLLKQNVDIYYASTTNISDFLPAFFASMLKKKVLLTKCHISIYKGNNKLFIDIYNNIKNEGFSKPKALINSFSPYIVFHLLSKANKIICVSNNIKQTLIYRGISENILEVNYNGLKIRKYKNRKKEYELAFVGRIEKYKGVYDFIKVCKEYKKIENDFKAIIIGEGSEFGKLKKIAKNLDRNIVFTGFLGEKRFELLSKSKIMLMPSTANEGWGLSIAESIACNTPVIAYDNEIFREVFGDVKNVYLVKNYMEMKNKMIKLLTDYKYNRNIYKQAKKFDIKKSVKREEEIIKKYERF
ncbi:hypothetical protein COV24_05155 [candidate division WWE3 bacterium CG10_big_fil_rev_8_21_14_0_10_32_10]|uniref:Glycosyl transferase family 1 domain-containing protein n=1 Tax=candidate division WWE3 bacterium CG10_big_fil_rev_8_21_14_0_10_32_10 TaxID=1975090 RepID=A0A2H0R903_UNCKA|nr:MAG: hypothetical protein COV24_05155 [candidate division WWE3 bacterium CG10_big_fil_rev_8_21_14_0_10_32_10]